MAAIEKGYVQKEIQESAYRFQKEIESNERIIVGLNKFQVQEEKPKELLKVDPTVRDQQVERLRELKGQRNQYQAQGCPDRSQRGGPDRRQPDAADYGGGAVHGDPG